MNKRKLSALFAETLFKIPAYQRGYAWEERQLQDFIEDIDALVAEKSTYHYTGTIVTYCAPRFKEVRYGDKTLMQVDIVDGQQRLTTVCLYLSEILRKLGKLGEKGLHQKVEDYLYSGATCKLTLGDDTANLFSDLIKTGQPNTAPNLPHETRLVYASEKFKEHLLTEEAKKGTEFHQYLKDLLDAITQRLAFTCYTIEEECEIGMTFELMNSRGKDLSVLELLKNYLMHWVSRNISEQYDRDEHGKLINKTWKDTYTNLGACDGEEDQCLRVAWTLFCSHLPAKWIGYRGFKDPEFIPLRDFSKKTKEDSKTFMVDFLDALGKVSKHYRIILNPERKNTAFDEETVWLTKILNTGNTANFLPLIVAARMKLESNQISANEYVELLRAVECFSYRVFLYGGRRSNAGKSSFHRWGWEIREGSQEISHVTSWIYDLIRYYHPENEFLKGNESMSDWYGSRRLLRYTLYEYELKLLADQGKGLRPEIQWENLGDSTIEHILPQNPELDSQWLKAWKDHEFKECLHDIGNLVLTTNNSNYRNFEFERKKGNPGISPSYCDSQIQQERKISSYPDWTMKEFLTRREELIRWINERWKTQGNPSVEIEVNEDENEEVAHV